MRYINKGCVAWLLCVFVMSASLLSGEQEEIDAVAPMEKGEKVALYSAIEGFVGDSWNGSELYPDPCGWTPIQGVSCDIYDGLWYVTALSIGPIHDNSIPCVQDVKFRSELFELKHLKSLSFFSCFMSPHEHPVTIPTENWSNLAGSLETLEFRSNPGLVGEVPTRFGALTKLQSLVLLENGLVGELPRNFSNLTMLKRLVLAGNWFDGKIPDTFGGLKELLILDLSGNSLTGALPMSFGYLTSLLKLDLSNNQLEGNLPTILGYLKNLTLLDLRNNRFSGGMTKSLQDLLSLEEMALSNNPIGGDLQGIQWQNLENLTALDLSSTGLTGSIPESITELKKLRFLGLSNNNLTGNIPPKLGNLPSLSALYLNGNNLTGELQFAESFYINLGRRFGAWNNPNLCYPIRLTSTTHFPYGVNQCQEEITLVGLNRKLGVDKWNNPESYSMASSYLFPNNSGLWWVFLVEVFLGLIMN